MSDALIPYHDIQQMAKAIATSGLFGIRTPEQALALMLIAQAEGLHPAVAARDYDIISGRPAKKSEAMLRSFIQSGGSVQWHELTDAKAEATFSHPQGGTIKLDWTMDRAKRAGLVDKQNKDGSPNMWHKYPRQMLRARVISEGVRTVCPSATGGMYVPEELTDDGESININSRIRRTRGGYTFKETVDASATPVEEPAEESVLGVVRLFRQIEHAADMPALTALGPVINEAQLSDEELGTARQLYKLRLEQLRKKETA